MIEAVAVGRHREQVEGRALQVLVQPCLCSLPYAGLGSALYDRAGVTILWCCCAPDFVTGVAGCIHIPCVATFAYSICYGDASFCDFSDVIQFFWQVCAARFLVATCHALSSVLAASVPESVTDAIPEARCNFLFAAAARYRYPLVLFAVPKLMLCVVSDALAMVAGERKRFRWVGNLPFLLLHYLFNLSVVDLTHVEVLCGHFRQLYVSRGFPWYHVDGVRFTLTDATDGSSITFMCLCKDGKLDMAEQRRAEMGADIKRWSP